MAYAGAGIWEDNQPTRDEQFLSADERLDLAHQRELEKQQREMGGLAIEQTKLDLTKQREAIERDKERNAMISDFLGTWGDLNQQSLKTLTSTLSGLDTGETGYAGSEELAKLMEDVRGQATKFEETYGGIESEAVGAAREDIQARRGLTTQFQDLAKADYEGATGRAAADVRGASSRAREAEAREAMSYGVDPTSGKFGALTKKSYMDEARNQAIAMNVARRGEKERVTDVTERGLSLIDPSKSYSVAQDIQGKRVGLIDTQAGLTKAGIAAGQEAQKGRLEMAKTKAGLAEQITNIGRDYGSAGMTQLGIQQAQAYA